MTTGVRPLFELIYYHLTPILFVLTGSLEYNKTNVLDQTGIIQWKPLFIRKRGQPLIGSLFTYLRFVCLYGTAWIQQGWCTGPDGYHQMKVIVHQSLGMISITSFLACFRQQRRVDGWDFQYGSFFVALCLRVRYEFFARNCYKYFNKEKAL